jgi:DNA-directed RNA polymerase specialized sigma24 family protein
MELDEREAVVLARALGFTVDEIADNLEISRADVLGRISRGLRRTLPPRRDCAGGASPAHAGRAS